MSVGKMRRRTFLLGGVGAALAACSRSHETPTAPALSRSTSTERPVTSSTAPPAPTTAAFVSRGDASSHAVALTFHTNGDPTVVSALLDLVAERAVPITAFVVGAWLSQHPTIGRRLVHDGHELSNHTQTHLSSFATRSASVMSSEIEGCRATLLEVVGTAGRWFRPSGTVNGVDDPGVTVRQRAAASGYATVVGYDVDPSDYADPGARAVRDRTLAAVRPGSIVSLHTGHQGTVDALPAIFDGLTRDGLTPVTVATLLNAT